MFKFSAVCPSGKIVAIDDKRMYYRTEVDDENVTGDSWVAIRTDNNMRAITCGKRDTIIKITYNFDV
jgi:hypothetical protein